ncbi:MAG: TadE/TadG family type IV pilus assembly protein [Isosphaeraceae bacterium]
MNCRKTAARRGASAVEMALVAPVFLTLVLGIIESSRLGMVAQLLSTAAREGCRVAVIQNSTQADVQNRVEAVLGGSGISVGTVTPTCTGATSWTSAPAGTPITVSLSVPYSAVSWLPVPYFLKTANVSSSATMSSERP